MGRYVPRDAMPCVVCGCDHTVVSGSCPDLISFIRSAQWWDAAGHREAAVGCRYFIAFWWVDRRRVRLTAAGSLASAFLAGEPVTVPEIPGMPWVLKVHARDIRSGMRVIDDGWLTSRRVERTVISAVHDQSAAEEWRHGSKITLEAPGKGFHPNAVSTHCASPTFFYDVVPETVDPHLTGSERIPASPADGRRTAGE